MALYAAKPASALRSALPALQAINRKGANKAERLDALKQLKDHLGAEYTAEIVLGVPFQLTYDAQPGDEPKTLDDFFTWLRKMALSTTEQTTMAAMHVKMLDDDRNTWDNLCTLASNSTRGAPQYLVDMALKWLSQDKQKGLLDQRQEFMKAHATRCAQHQAQHIRNMRKRPTVNYADDDSDDSPPKSKSKSHTKPPLGEIPYKDLLAFDKIVGCDSLISKLKNEVCYPRFPNVQMVKRRAMHALFYGPPGCGKSLLARACAQHMSYRVNFSPRALSMGSAGSVYQSETESNIRELLNTPKCTIIIDEAETLLQKRSADSDTGKQMAGVVNEFLQHIDTGAEATPDSTLILACTNNLSNVDTAACRRFGLKVLVDLPNLLSRMAFIKRTFGLAKKISANEVEELALKLHGYSFDDMALLAEKVVTSEVNTAFPGYFDPTFKKDSAGRPVYTPVPKGTPIQPSMVFIGSPMEHALRGFDLTSLHTQDHSIDEYLELMAEIRPTVTPEEAEDYRRIHSDLSKA